MSSNLVEKLKLTSSHTRDITHQRMFESRSLPIKVKDENWAVFWLRGIFSGHAQLAQRAHSCQLPHLPGRRWRGRAAHGRDNRKTRRKHLTRARGLCASKRFPSFCDYISHYQSCWWLTLDNVCLGFHYVFCMGKLPYFFSLHVLPKFARVSIFPKLLLFGKLSYFTLFILDSYGVPFFSLNLYGKVILFFHVLPRFIWCFFFPWFYRILFFPPVLPRFIRGFPFLLILYRKVVLFWIYFSPFSPILLRLPFPPVLLYICIGKFSYLSLFCLDLYGCFLLSTIVSRSVWESSLFSEIALFSMVFPIQYCKGALFSPVFPRSVK